MQLMRLRGARFRMSNTLVPSVYKWIIEDVIEKSHRHFAELGIDENILIELQQTWEQKLVQLKSADDGSQPKDLPTRPVASMDREVLAYLQKVNQNDGVDDEDEEDEDDQDNSINSELDESEEDGDAETSNLMLCQYEKVTRVKNKWKCVFKDGIISINGQDHLFNKSTGEFEW